MQKSLVLLKSAGHAVLTTIGDGIVRDSVVHLLPEVAQELWSQWSLERDDSQRRVELETLAQASAREVRQMVEDVVAEVAADRHDPVREALATYLMQLLSLIRHSLRRPSDPSGTTIPSRLHLLRPEDLLPFLPLKLPRFHPGERLTGIGEWELEELLGVSVLGEVWKARRLHTEDGQPVALKFCFDSPAKERLLQETAVLQQVMSHVKHPGIVQLRNAFLHVDPPCLEYEYVPGGDMTALIHQRHRSRSKADPVQATQIIRQLAKVLGYAHRLRPALVHRDLKPANILMQPLADSKFMLKVADFGIGNVAAMQAIEQSARWMPPAVYQASVARGTYTPLYASLQQMRGDPPDPRDDVYALGVIWHQLMIGDLATGRPSGQGWRKRLVDQGVAAPLIDLLAACVADEPDERPANAANLAEALTALLRGEPIPAHMTTPPPPPPPPAPSPSPARTADRVGEIARLEGHQAWVLSTIFSPDGRRAFSGSMDRTVRIWEMPYGRELRCLDVPTMILGLACARDCNRLLVAGWDGTVRLVDCAAGQELRRFQGHTEPVQSVAFSPDNRLALSGSWDQTIRLWDVNTGQEIRRFEGHTEKVSSVVFSPDGHRALSGGLDQTVRLWEVASGRELARFEGFPGGVEFEGYAGGVSGVAFLPDGRRFLSGSLDKTLWLWELTSEQELRQFEGHSEEVTSVACLPDGNRALSGSKDKTVRLWDINTGREIHCFNGHAGPVLSVACSPDGRLGLSASQDQVIRVWGLPK